MGTQQVVEKILADARAQAEDIKKQAQEKQTAEQEKLNQQLTEYHNQSRALAEKTAKDEKLHILAAARMEIAKQHLAEKRKILDSVFDKAKQSLLDLPDEEYVDTMTKLMLDTVETGDEEVIVDKNEKRIDQSFIKQVNRKLGPGYKGNLRLADEKMDIGAGFILRRGKIKNNVSIDVLLAQARKDLEIDLAKQLFASDSHNGSNDANHIRDNEDKKHRRSGSRHECEIAK